MKKVFLFLSFLVLVACSSNNNDGLELAKNYTGEIVSLVNDAYLEITGQASEGELEDGLIEYTEKIRVINDKYWDGTKFGEYTDEQISKWKFLMENNQGDKWEIKGKELSEALAYMNLYSSMLADDIETALEDRTDESYRNLGETLGVAQQSAGNLVKIILNR